MDAICFNRLAALFKYPPNDLASARSLAGSLGDTCPAAGADLRRWVDAVAALTLEELQELYIQTFEMNPVCSLEVGWQLHGEHYERGEFLVRMRQALRDLGVEESAELPDHLTHVLAMTGRLGESQQVAFATESLQPAIAKMAEALAGTGNPYRHLIQATVNLVTAAATACAAGGES